MKALPFLSVFLFSISAIGANINPLQKMADELAIGLHKYGACNVAVLSIPQHDGHSSDGPEQISEQLAQLLKAEPKISVIERAQLKQALTELHLSQNGVLEPQQAKLIGNVLKADVIVTGTIINLPEEISEVNVRALVANSGKIIAASRCVITRSWDERRRLY